MAQIPATDSRDILVDPLTLEEILTVFNNPINEEQAWAVCHQCAHYFSVETARSTFRDLYTHGIRSVRIKKDGDVIIDATEVVLSKGQQGQYKDQGEGRKGGGAGSTQSWPYQLISFGNSNFLNLRLIVLFFIE